MAITYNSDELAQMIGGPNYLQSLAPNVMQGITAQDAENATGGMFKGVGDWFKSSGFVGSTDGKGVTTQGWGGTALGIGQGLANAFMGMKQYGLAKDQLQFSKDQFNRNFQAQQKTTNARLEDRQAARVASNPGAYQSVGDYMKRYGI